MPSTFDPAARGSTTIIVSEAPVRAPLAHGIPWSTPTLSVPIGHDAQVRPVSRATVDQSGGKLNRQ
jgi:hypothetical protein